MLVDFEFATAGRIIAGPGRAAELPGAVAGLGSPVLVCTGAGRGVPGGRRAHGRVGPGVAAPVSTVPMSSPRSAAAASSMSARLWPCCWATAGTPWITWRLSGPVSRSRSQPCHAWPRPPPLAPGRRSPPMLFSPPQRTGQGEDGRSASTSCGADAAVNQIKSITISGRRAAIWAPKVPLGVLAGQRPAARLADHHLARLGGRIDPPDQRAHRARSRCSIASWLSRTNP